MGGCSGYLVFSAIIITGIVITVLVLLVFWLVPLSLLLLLLQLHPLCLPGVNIITIILMIIFVCKHETDGDHERSGAAELRVLKEGSRGRNQAWKKRHSQAFSESYYRRP